MGTGTHVILHFLFLPLLYRCALWRGGLPTALESPVVYTCELRVFAMCPALRDPLYHMLESPTFPSTVLSTL